MKYRNICRVFALMLTLVIVLLAMSACGAKSCGGDVDPLDGGTTEAGGTQNGGASSSNGTGAASDGTTTKKEPQPYEDPDLLEPI